MLTKSPRLYKAGDLCRWTEDGQVEFCGRIDAQVKLRGYRIELSEIESVMMTLDNVQTAVVSVREDTPGIQNLCGYVILKDPSLPFDQDVLKEGIKARCPPYFVPACIDVVTKFPTLPSGKVNRKELPPPKNLVVISEEDDAAEEDDPAKAAEAAKKAAEAEEDPNFFPCRSPLERKLAGMWRKLFQRPKISSTDDFFTLGGHSLLAAWLVSALRKDPKTEHVTMADVYGFPVLREMAWKLEGKDPGDLGTPQEEAEQVRSGARGASDQEQKEQRRESAASGGDGDGNHAGNPEDDDGIPMLHVQKDGEDSFNSAAGLSAANRKDHLANFASISNFRFIMCGIFQLCALYFLFALPAFQSQWETQQRIHLSSKIKLIAHCVRVLALFRSPVGIPWQLYLKVRLDGWQYIIIMLLPFSVAIFPVYVFLAIAAKWSVREGAGGDAGSGATWDCAALVLFGPVHRPWNAPIQSDAALWCMADSLHVLLFRLDPPGC
jgi:hypothetical protein